MDGAPYFFLMLFLLAGVWWLDRNRRRLARRAREKGDQWGKEITEHARAEHAVDARAAMGRSLVLLTEHEAALAVVDELVERKRLYRPVEPGVWQIEFVRKDDLIVSAAPTTTGTEVVLTSLRDGTGFPGAGMWTQFLDRLEKVATKQGIAVQECTGATYASRPAPDHDGVIWFRD